MNALLHALATAALALTASLVLTAAPAAPRTDRLPLRPKGLDEVVDRLADEIPAQVRNHKVLVCWLLDSTRLMQRLEVHEQIAARIETAFAPMGAAWKDKVLMAVCSMGGSGRPAGVVSPVSPDPAQAAKAVRELGASPDETYKNTLDAVRQVAQVMTTFAGRRILVLVTLENGDTEDTLEKTAEKLQAGGVTLHVVSREAVYADPMGEARSGGLHALYRANELELGFDLAGLDAPAAEYPVGWILDRTGLHDAVPSGFGFYTLSRLALATGGTYSIYPPPDPVGPLFCAEAGCSLCDGSHAGCDAVYDPARLALLAPSLAPRDAYRGELGKVALARAFFQAWQIAWDAGLCAMPPPWDARGGNLAPPKGARNARGPLQPRPWGTAAPPEGTPWTGWDLESITHGGLFLNNTYKEEDPLQECDKALQTLENALRTASLPEPSRRLVAASETLLCQLYATRFNLGQFRALNEELKLVEAALPAPGTVGAFARPAFAEFRRRAPKTWIADYRNIWFCHGAERAADVHFLGGAPARRDEAALCERIDRNIQKYRGTPWEILTRRIGLVVLRPFTIEEPEADAKAARQPRAPKAKGPDAPKPPFTHPSRPARNLRGSTLLPVPGIAGVPSPGPGTVEDKRAPTVTPPSQPRE